MCLSLIMCPSFTQLDYVFNYAPHHARNGNDEPPRTRSAPFAQLLILDIHDCVRRLQDHEGRR